jgi:flagellar biosynthesis anti-sigma factor FlgM
MSEVGSIGSSNIPPTNRATGRSSPSAPPTAQVRDSDKVELSQRAQLLSRLAELPDVRQDLVDRVKAEIADGGYDTPDKVDQLLDELAHDLL